MSLTLGMTGMDPATETALRAAFGDANAQVGGRWTLVPETEADHVMVDMDSMYGPMSWLRLHAAGKRVIGLTTAPRTQTDFRLGRPFDSDAFATLLRDVAHGSGIAPGEAAATPQRAALATRAPDVHDVHDAAAAVPDAEASSTIGASGHIHSTTPGTRDDSVEPATPGRHAAPSNPVAPLASSSTVAETMSPAAHASTVAARPPSADPVALSPAPPSGSTPAPAPQHQLPDETIDAIGAPAVAEPAVELPPAPPIERTLAQWLDAGVLSQRVRYRRSSGPMLLIDPGTRTYHGPSTLKPFTSYFRDAVDGTAFESVDDASWTRDSEIAGAAQPLLRLQWLGGMVSGRAALGDDHASGSRFRLMKWPQTEREFPKHFRIATAMMKGPATLAEIADASNMPIDEVFEFVNANLVTGFAERVVDVPADTTPPDAPRAGGLLGRLRGR